MDSVQFYNEVIHSDLCPDNFETIYKKFSEYQKLALDTLKEFHRICEKNNIRYQLAHGSLLGAVRDNGQIPWDYDIDVWVPYEEKEALLTALRKDLSDSFYFYSPDTDRKCRHFMMRLAPNGYRTETLHVDVFFVVGLPEDEEESQALRNKLYLLYTDRFYKLVNIFEESHGNLRTFLTLLYNKVKRIGKSVESLNKEFDEACSKYHLDESKNCASVDILMRRKPFNRERLWDTELKEMSTGVFRITKNYDEVLRLLHHDYNKISPLKNRLDEMMRSYYRLEKYAKKK